MGLNCATGPQEMAEHVRWLAANWPGLLSIQPNAGLPELVDGQTRYPLGAEEMASWVERFVAEDGMNLIGGCCGTSIPHIQALDAMLRRRGRARGGSAPRRCRASRCGSPPSPSLYQQVSLRQENAFFAIGERCNANGSKKWRELQEKADWDGCVSMGREQIAEGSNSLDVCTAFVGRDEIGRDERGDPPLHQLGECAAGDRQHRNPGDRGGAEAAWRQADHQLDQFRGWRGPCHRPADPGEEVRRRGDRADHRRDRHGEDRRGQIAHRRTAGRFRLQQARAARSPTC